LSLAAFLFEENGCAVVAQVTQVSEIEPGKVALGRAVIAGDDHAAASDALLDEKLAIGGDIAQTEPGRVSGSCVFLERERAWIFPYPRGELDQTSSPEALHARP
jgi:hypothetical protein